MNIYEKLQDCRVQLKNKDLKQTGLNKFSNYTYFELGDFLPQAMDIMKDLKLTPLFGFEVDKAKLTLMNSEKIEEQIVFESPSVIPELKGCNAIQNIGASQTYMRRYLYVMAFELSEFDMVNPTSPQENDEEAEMQKILKRPINEIEKEAFEQAVTETDTKIDLLFKLMKYNGKPGEMTFGTWKDAMAMIDSKKAKMPKKNNINLGL